MPYVQYSNFKSGYDTRRSELTSQPGTLQVLQDCHVNEGAEIELRKAFLNASFAAANTFGLETVTNGLLTFGSITDPGGWSGNVAYQQLVHPAVTDGATYNATFNAMTKVNCSTSFGGFAWVAATYSDGRTYVFWNGTYIPAFRNGIVLEGWDTNQDIVTQLRNYINSLDLDGFTVGAVMVGVGTAYDFLFWSLPNQAFTLIGTPTPTNTGSGTISTTIVSNQVDAITAVAAQTTFTLTGGSSGQITSVETRIGAGAWSANLLSAAVPFATSLAQTATNIAFAINTNSASNLNFSAVSTGTSITIFADPAQGTTENGMHLQVVSTGNLTTDNVIFNFTSAWAVGDLVSSIKYNSTGATLVEILGSTITYAVGDATLLGYVTRIATTIAAFTATYTAYAYAVATPANSVNLIISRITAASDDGAATATNGATCTFTSASGQVNNGLNGGSGTTAAPITVTISPSTFNRNSAGGQYTFVGTGVGGVGTLSYSWALSNGSGAFDSILSGANTNTVIVQHAHVVAASTLSLTVSDTVGNTKTKSITL